MNSIKVMLVLAALVAAKSDAADLAGSSDHPLLTRFPESTIVGYQQAQHDRTWLPSAPQSGNTPKNGQWVTGRLTWIIYHVPETHSTLEIFKNYEKALADAGFDITFSCKKDKCGNRFIKGLLNTTGRMFKGGERWMPDTARYLAAHSNVENEIWVSLAVYERNQQGAPRVRLEIIEANEPRSLDLLPAEELAKKTVNYDEARMAAGARVNNKLSRIVDLEGAVDWRAHRIKGASAYEAFAAHRRALVDQGYAVQFECNMSACGTRFIRAIVDLNENIIPGGERWSQDSGHYVVAKLASPTQLSWVGLLSYRGAGGSTVTRRLMVNPDEIEFNLISVNSDSMAKELDESGKVAVYGMYFDTDSAELKPESSDTLAEIAKLLQNRPDLKLYVDGHTDAEGSDEHNSALSQSRAEAVVAALSNLVDGVSTRLQARGFGETQPVASNDSDQGRAWNRRVELVARE